MAASMNAQAKKETSRLTDDAIINVAGVGEGGAYGFSAMASSFEKGCLRVVNTEMHWWFRDLIALG